MAGVNSRMANVNVNSPILNSSGPSIGPISSTSVNRPSVASPALPPRPVSNTRLGVGGMGMGSGYGMPLGGYGSFGSSLGGYGSYGSGLGGYGSYGGGLGGYGGFGYGGGYGQSFGSHYGGYGGNGMFGNMENRFIQAAEESSRPAFQSIESLVSAVGSVAMMLESTFVAITSSFRAILGVADNFGRLRSMFAQFWSAFAVVRGLNWLLKKLLVLMGIRTEDEFRAWAEATAGQGSGMTVGEDRPRSSSWPVLLFLGIITSAPYIIMKLLGSLNSTIQSNTNDPTTWQNPHKGLTQYDFQATSPQEIGFRANQVITIAPEALQGNLWNSGWLIATVDMKTAGLVPANYVKLFRPNSQINELPVSGLPPANVPLDTISEEVAASNSHSTRLQDLVTHSQPLVVPDFEKYFENAKNTSKSE